MIRKFKCEVTSTSEYVIEIDDSVWSEEALENWSRVFCDVDNLEEVVKILAIQKTKYDAGEFIEGFGIPKINGRVPYTGANQIVNNDVNINIIYEDDLDSNVVEIE